MKIIKRIKEWIEYRNSMKVMHKCVEHQEEVIHDDSLDEETKNRLFTLYARLFEYHSTNVMIYQQKYRRKKG